MRFLSLAALFCLTVPVLSAQSNTDYRTNPKFIKSLREGKVLALNHHYGFAIDAYKKAEKIAGGEDFGCFREIFMLQLESGQYKDAVKTAEQMQALANNPIDKSLSESNRGEALYYQAVHKHKNDLMADADAAFKDALKDYPRNAIAHFMDGRALARLGQMDAASAQFKECLNCISTTDPSYIRAQHFAANPALSLQKMAPAFTVTALDGSTFTLDKMGGRVVLIDFWATWCGPCREELPQMKRIAKEFAGEPLVIISISWDSDAQKWKDFIAKNEMTWEQYRDADHSLTNLFEVQAIPHYFTIDSDGALTSEMLGSGSDVEGKIKKLIARAKAEETHQAPAQPVNKSGE